METISSTEAVLRFLNGGDLLDVPEQVLEWDEQSDLRRQARQTYDAREGAPQVVVYMCPADSEGQGPVADFYALEIIPASDEAADAWVVWGDLRADDEGFLVIGTLAVAPYLEAFGRRGIGYPEWSAIRPARIRDAAKDIIATIGGLHEMPLVLGRRGEDGVRAFETPLVDHAAGERAAEHVSAAPTPTRGRPSRPMREHFDLSVRFLLAQRARSRLGVYARLGQHYGVKQETLRSRTKQAERLELLSKGEPNKPASRRAGAQFEPFWHSLADGDSLKELARELVSPINGSSIHRAAVVGSA